MSLFRNESPNLGSLATSNWLSGSDVLLARDMYAIPTAGPHEQVFGKPPLTSTVIDPNTQRSYAIVATSATAFTLGAPSLGPLVSGSGVGPLSDGKVIIVKSFTNFPHSISAPGLILNGTSTTPLDFILFPSYAGASVELTAYQGFWLVDNFNGVTFGTGAPGSPQFGFASTYVVGAQASITNTGTTTLNGNIYLNPGSSITGSPTVTGRTDVDNAAAVQAEAAVLAAWNAGWAQVATLALPASLNSVTLTPGVYSVASTTGTTGAATVSFDAQGNANATWTLQVGTSASFGAGTTIVLLNGAQAKNILWLIGSSFTVAGTGFVAWFGNVLAAVSISLGTSGTETGRFFAGAAGNNTGAITFAGGNTVSIP